MRRPDTTQHAMFSYWSLEERIPASHPEQKLQLLIDRILASMDTSFEQQDSRTRRPSIPLKRLLRASLIQAQFSIRSEQQLAQQTEYNLLYRWFVGLSVDDDVCGTTTFGADFKGEKRKNDTRPSTTDSDAPLFKKGEEHNSRLCYMGHTLMENRSGLVVDVEKTKASGTSDFVQSMRQKVTPHVAAKKSNSAINGRTTRHAGYAVSFKKRKLVEEIFGLAKTVGSLRKTQFIGLAKVTTQTVFTFAFNNSPRMATLVGWRFSAV